LLLPLAAVGDVLLILPLLLVVVMVLLLLLPGDAAGFTAQALRLPASNCRHAGYVMAPAPL
jgi:hypothetical protein